jgi:ribonuclease G
LIDVNSGNKSNSEEDQEATALSVNREAAKEIARQLRLQVIWGDYRDRFHRHEKSG